MTPLFSTLLGACVGSFLNVCISRLKSGEKIFFPPSHCPRCHRTIAWYDNIPILSFALLGARCRGCHKTISWQYPLVEAATALLFGISAVCFREWPLIVASELFVSFMVLLAVSDLKWKLLPHPFTNLFVLFGLFFSIWISKAGTLDLFHAVSHFILVGFILYAANLIVPNGMGGGDIKMGAGLAIWLGLSRTFAVLLLAFLAATLMVLPLLGLRKATKKSAVPFGPFLASFSLLLWFCPDLANHLGMDL